MNSEIKDMIKKFPICLNFQNRQPSKPIINAPIPNQAWAKIAADPFTYMVILFTNDPLLFQIYCYWNLFSET